MLGDKLIPSSYDDKINHYHQKIIEYTLNNKSIENLSINDNCLKYHNYEWGFDENTLIKLPGN